jgi:Ca2+-binding RTX toxin-like protein
VLLAHAMRPTRLILACSLTLVVALAGAAAPAEAKVTSTFSNGVLTVRGSGHSDRISARCGIDGNVKANGRDPKGGPVPCSRVSEIDFLAGDGDDVIDCHRIQSGFGSANFRGFGEGTGVAAMGGAGDDHFIGAPGAFNFFLGGEGNDRASGGPHRDLLSGGIGADQIKGLGRHDILLGKAGPDVLNGGDGRDLVSGNGGNDVLRGGPGGDELGGGFGRDVLHGGPGNDRLLGGPGRDILDGGPGRDRLIQDPPKRRK